MVGKSKPFPYKIKIKPMKTLALLILLLSLFTACKSKTSSILEQKDQKPINPTKWLSQIKNEEAKKRTIDVLEKIYISTAYSIAEKDSLSEMQVKFANCEADIKIFNGWKAETYSDISEGRSRAYHLLSFYKKDIAIFKAALNVIVDTSFLYIGKESYPSYYYKGRHNNPEKLSKIKPSKELLERENEILELMDSSKKIGNGNSEDSNSQAKKLMALASQKLFQLLKEPTAYDYAIPKLDDKITVLYSPNKQFRVFYFTDYAENSYEGGYRADVYIQYRKSENSKLIVDKIECREVNEHNYCNPMFPEQIFQVEKNGNPVFIILHEYNGEMQGERYGILQAIEIKDEKAIPCKDCIEGEELKIYHRDTNMGSYPIFDEKKQRLYLISYPLVPPNNSINIRKRYVLQWNGQQLVSIPLKLYCEE